MLIFYEMAPQPPPNGPQQHPNAHLVPTVTPAGPSPVIKVPNLPGVQPPPMIKAVPQQQQPGLLSRFSDMSTKQKAMLVGGGLAAGALVSHLMNPDHSENGNNPTRVTPQQQNVAPQKATTTVQQPTVKEIHHYHHDSGPPGSPTVAQNQTVFARSPTSNMVTYYPNMTPIYPGRPMVLPGVQAAGYGTFYQPVYGPHPRVGGRGFAW